MYLTHLYPPPKSMKEDRSSRYFFGAKETLHINHTITSEIADRLCSLWNRFCCTASTLEIAVHEEDASADYIAWLGTRTELSTEHYSIRAYENGVTLAAVNERALIDGFTTLMQLICPVELDVGEESFYISTVEIDDKPTIGFRSIHLCIFPNSDLFTLEKAIHMAGFFKFTHVVLEFWGTLEYDILPELSWADHAMTKTQAKELIRLANSYGMEVIPMFNHLGHASGSRSCYGRHTILNRNLRLAKLFEPDGWTWCTSNPKTFRLLSEVRSELIDLCGKGSYFHIGVDEAYSFASCDKCRERVPHELLADYINALTEDLAKYGRRPIMWHDELIEGKNFTCKDSVVANGQNHHTAGALDLLDKRVIVADWQYGYVSGDNPTTPYFMDKGFDTILCPWDSMGNVRSLCENARSLGAYGVMLTTWHHLTAYLAKLPLVANYTWQDGNYGGYADTEAAMLLRTVYDTKGDFLSSGWHKNEVEE